MTYEDIVRLYAETDERLRSLVQQLENGNLSTRRVEQLNREIEQIVAELAERAGLNVATLIGNEYRTGVAIAVNQMIAAGRAKESIDVSVKSLQHQRAVQAISDEAFYSILESTDNMAMDTKERIKKAVQLANEKSLTLGMSRKESTKQAVAELNTKGITGIVAKNGAEIPADKYVAGVVHYHQRKAHVTGTENMATQNGYDLVYVNYVGITCEHCARKQGRVYSLSGNDKRWPHMTDEYKPPYHSHCVHSISIWVEEYQSPEEVERLLDISNKLGEETRSEQHINRYKEIQAQKAQLNADRKQWERYREVVQETPKTFSAFRRMKNSNAEQWQLTQLDYRRQRRLTANPELALPNAGKASAADAKFSKYLFNPDNPVGYAKGAAFTSRLGYNSDNWKKLQSEIIERSSLYPSTLKLTDQHGSRYEQKMILYGVTGKPTNVVVGWNVANNETKMTTAYIKEVKSGGGN
ncbi:phage minor capsid protein [Paenibacillus yanchengensis]|uniref:Phage minor capsid protein n=1 Tax=Paenibacillus yanchengensis TaxID=2035833 RepID=A0ABW4YLG3_9BACL